jgi:hypothetical protein
MRVRRLAIALLVGVGLQALLLLFGLHASLWLARFTGEHHRIYWVLNGVYLVCGVAFGLIAIRWAPARLRVPIGVAVLLIGVVVGLLSPST